MARPSLYERRPQWGEGQRFHERIQLEPLSQLSSRRMVRELLKNVPEVPTALRDLVVDRADGNPFYIEELIKALIDDHVILKGEESWSVDTTRLSSVRIPATLTGVLQARLDTLPAPLHQLLQRASVVGRIFWDAAAIHLSRETAGLKPDDVQEMLEELRHREMILRREESGFAGTVEYVFRHAIFRDVTYETLIPRQRRALHKLVGDWLIEIGGERAGEHTLLVAEHYGRAEEPALAAAQLSQAGERAIQLATYEEASTLLERARAMLTHAEHTEQRLGIDLLRSETETFRGRYANAGTILRPALEEARGIGNLRLQATVLGQLGRIAMWQGDTASGLKYVGEALEMARKAGDMKALIFSLRQMGNMLVQTDPARARTYNEESVELARKAGDLRSEAAGLNSLGIAYTLEGRYEEAMATYERALTINRARGDRANLAMVLSNVAGLHAISGDLATAERTALESIAIADEIGAVGLRPSGEAVIVEVYLRRKRGAESLVWIRAFGASLRNMGLPLAPLAFFYGILKLIHGDRARGLAWIGFARANDPNRAELAVILRSFRDIIRAEASEDEVEAAMKAGESLTIDGILAEAESESTASPS
jgi:predicted ATPase